MAHRPRDRFSPPGALMGCSFTTGWGSRTSVNLVSIRYKIICIRPRSVGHLTPVPDWNPKSLVARRTGDPVRVQVQRGSGYANASRAWDGCPDLVVDLAADWR